MRARLPGRRRACSRAADAATKNRVLTRLAELLDERVDEVVDANAADLADERAAGLTEALRDRLTVTPERVAAMAEGVRAIIALPDPVGEELERQDARERPRPAQGAGAARRRRGGL